MSHTLYVTFRDLLDLESYRSRRKKRLVRVDPEENQHCPVCSHLWEGGYNFFTQCRADLSEKKIEGMGKTPFPGDGELYSTSKEAHLNLGAQCLQLH